VVQVYDTSSGTLQYELQTRGIGDGDGTHLYFTPDGQQLVTARANVVQFWEAATGAPVRTLEVDGLEDYSGIIMLALSADGRYMALAHTGPRLSVYDLATNEQLWLDEYVVELHTCCFAPDSSVLLATSGKRIVRYDAHTGQQLAA
jgi:WD40 repeat protein